MHRSLGDLADEFLDVVGLERACGEPARAIDIRMGHGSARIRLEGERLQDPTLAEVSDQRSIVAVRGPSEAMEHAVGALEYRARTDEPGAAQERRAQARLRRPAGMQPLGPCALGEIFDDAARHAAGDAERADGLAR